MKKREMTVAEPEMVYGRAMQGCLMHCIVPKKDQSFFEDLAKVRSWKIIENQEKIEQPKARRMAKSNTATSKHEPNACTVRAMKEALEDMKAGRVHQYDSVDDMFDQILGKGWKAKTNTKAPVKTARVKRSVAPKAEGKRSAHLDESLRQIENGEYFEASSAEEMCEQIFGKGWRTK